MSLDLKPTRGGWLRRARLSLRIARRDIGAHRGRSALIVALIALPIIGVALGGTVALSAFPSGAETARTELGTTQGRLTPFYVNNAHAYQGTRGDLGGTGVTGDDDPNFQRTPPIDAAPAGYTAIPWNLYSLTMSRNDVTVSVTTVATDPLNPAFTGKYTLLEGRAPARTDEVLVSPGLLESGGWKIGDTLSTQLGSVVVTGTLRTATRDDSSRVLFVSPDQVPAEIRTDPADTTVYLVGDRPLTWSDTAPLNAQGVMVTSRDLLINPPTGGEISDEIATLSEDNRLVTILSIAGLIAVVGVLALFEVCLLAGAAFAMGARRQQRELALLSASGAESASLRQVVTASGIWLGLLGGIIGATLGTAAGVAVVLGSQAEGSARFASLQIAWPVSLFVVIVGLLAGLVAASVPARQVAKQATLAALKGGRTVAGPTRRALIAGVIFGIIALLLFGGMVALTLTLSPFPQDSAVSSLWWALSIGGALALATSLIVLTGPLIDAISRRAAGLPLPLRLAARDAGRNRGRATPAVAAVLAAAMLASLVMVTMASNSEKDRRNYNWNAHMNQAALELVQYRYSPTTHEIDRVTRVDPERVLTAVTASVAIPPTSHTLYGPEPDRACAFAAQAEAGGNPTACENFSVYWPDENRCEIARDGSPKDLTDWRCQGAGAHGPGSINRLPAIAVGDESDLAALLGREPGAQAKETLRNGGIVLSSPAMLGAQNTATIVRYTNEVEAIAGETAFPGLYTGYQPNISTGDVIPASVAEPDVDIPYYGVISPETAKKLGMTVVPVTQLLTFAEMPTTAESDRMTAAVEQLAEGASLWIEGGPNAFLQQVLWWIVLASALITLSAAGITAGLALADGRADQATLAGVGASTRLRRSVSAAQTLLTATLGTALGLIAGAIPAVLIFTLTRDAVLVVPWVQFGVLLAVVPLAGALAAWLLTRGSLPLTRRQTLV
ncbi:ABC transporter permease [Mycetocola tolaasinivorans]|nr:FtsX-like permease family protein [Mycetocola tolaasinivorans]